MLINMVDLRGALYLLIYLGGVASSIALITHLAKLPLELSRKSYHIMICFAMILLLTLFEAWYNAIATLAAYMLLAFILVEICGRLNLLDRIAIARKRNYREVGRQIGTIFLSFSVLIAVFWGLLGEEWKFIAALGVMSLGFGDAAAALVGKQFGKIKLPTILSDGKKTVEGSLAMFVCSATAIFVVLWIMTDLAWWINILLALTLGVIGAVVEASTPKGWDTLSLPLTVSGAGYVILQFVFRFGI